MTELLTLETDAAFVEILPQLGGSVAAFDFKVGSTMLPIFRRWSGDSENPRTFASSPIVPWFNRIEGGGLTLGGRFYPIGPTDPTDPFPLHGDGWFSRWEVTEHTPSTIALRLRSRAIPPFDYEARLVYALAGATLDTELSVTNRGSEPVPFGLGQHPWFPRTPAATIEAPASGAWLTQPPAFPANAQPEPVPEAWDFSKPRKLPDDFIDNGFSGWNGRARIAWPDRGVAVEIEADPATHYYHVYSLDADCPIFCFEPVTHPFNAYAWPGEPAAKGLRVLAPGEETSLKVRFTAGPA